MRTREDLEKRVAELESEVSALKRGSPVVWRGVRRRSAATFAGLPLYDIAIGPDLERGEFRGHAKGIIAIGDFATGVLALGGLVRGIIAVGGLAFGALSLGGLSLGIGAIGGLAIGGIALGGGAIGGAAIGGAAIGHYACGGGALGEHVISPLERDPLAVEFFERYGLDVVCPL
ncbi:MAG TPA: hypothetical protein VIC71_09055 [Gammaproteobacteria bacterium]|jgi:hypothetical protein